MSQTTFRCDCGINTGHTREAQCDANRAATMVYMGRQHDAPLVEIHTDSRAFVRFATNEETGLPHGAAVADGRVSRGRLWGAFPAA